MEYDIRFEYLDSRPLAVVRRRASQQELSKVVPEACGAVWNVVRAQQSSISSSCEIGVEEGAAICSRQALRKISYANSENGIELSE